MGLNFGAKRIAGARAGVAGRYRLSARMRRGGRIGVYDRTTAQGTVAILIIYELGCSQGHRFEGWFASGDDFARQSDAAMVRCPVCDDQIVAIVPSAKVRVARHGAAAAPAPAVAAAAPTAQTTDATANDAVTGLPVELLRKLREAVRNTEDVGHRFPEEARKIHYEEAPARAIRGRASPDEAEALRDEGIDFATLPPFLTRDPH
jgi:hypothetical protein